MVTREETMYLKLKVDKAYMQNLNYVHQNTFNKPVNAAAIHFYGFMVKIYRYSASCKKS